MANQIKAPINYPVIAGGKIVAGGSVLFGQPNVKPDEDNPSTLKAVYLDAALTQPAQNPQGLSSDGVFDQSDTGILFGPENTVYSIVIKGANKKELSYIPEYDLSDSNAAATAQDAAAAAASSEANALSFKNLTEALYTDFTNRYFGAFSSDPSVDGSGNPPNEGSIYFNSTSNVFFTWTDGAWVNHFPSNPNGLLVTATGTTTPRTLGDRAADVINAIDEGAVSDGVTNNTESLEQMQAKNKNDAIELSKGGYVIDSDAKIEDVIYKGKGVFVTKNSPNIATSGLSSTLGLFNNGVIPERHLRRVAESASRGSTVKVMIIGDSLSTPYVGADATMDGSPDCLWGYLKRRIQRLNVNTQFEFINRAIGGRTFSSVNSSQFSSVPTNINWYTEDKPWIDYIVDESPDLVFISFGMNDRENIVIPQFNLMMQTLLSMANVPDIIFCTNMVPSRMSDSDNISSEKSNEGRDFAAGYVRHYAQVADFGLIDVNRHYHLIIDGTDVENTYMSKVADGAASIPYTAPSTALCSNFTFKLEMASLESGVLNDLNIENGERLRIQTAPEKGTNNPNSSSYIDIGTRGGFIAVEVNDNVDVGWNPNKYGTGVGGYGYTNYTTTAAAPSVGSQCDIYVTVKGANLIVSLNNEIILDVLIRRLGQVFRPKVFFKNASVNPSVNLTLYQGRYAKICHPLLTSSEIWEELENNGGNGLNHPNTKATVLIYGPIIDSTNLSIPPICVGSTNYPSTMGNRKIIGGNRAKGTLTLGALSDDSPLVDTLPAATSNNVVLVGAGNNIGETVLVPDSGAYVRHITTETEQGSLSESYVPATGTRKTRIKGQDVLNLIVPTADTFTGAQLVCFIGGSLVVKPVRVGSADSGGTGFRALIIAN